MDYSQSAIDRFSSSSSEGAEEGARCACGPKVREGRRGRVRGALEKAGKFVVQLTFLAGVCYLGGAVAAALPIGIPGNIVSMILLLVLLVTGMLQSAKIDLASNFLLKFMPLFFIPAGVSIMGCFPIIADHLVQFALVCVITTVLVFAVTSATVTAAMKAQQRLARRRGGSGQAVEGARPASAERSA